MKKTIILFATIFIVIFLTGCVRSETVMVIKADKSMEFSSTYLISDTLLGLSEDGDGLLTDDEQKSSLQERGYKVIEYSEDEYSGIKISKSIDNIDNVSTENATKLNLSTLLDVNSEEQLFFTVQKGFLKNTYTANIVYDLTSEEDNASGSEDESFIDTSFYTNAIEIEYSVKLPKKALQSNSTDISEDGLTNTWKAKYGVITEINYSFEMINYTNLIILISGGIVLSGGTLALLLIVNKKKKSKLLSNNS